MHIGIDSETSKVPSFSSDKVRRKRFIYLHISKTEGISLNTILHNQYGSNQIYEVNDSGVEVLEVHVALSREMFGPDVPASVTTAELRQLVEGIRFIERMKASPLDKNLIAQEMSPLRELFTKSVVARVDLPSGTILWEEYLTIKKPGTGIPASRLLELIGARLKHDVKADTLLSESDME